MPTSSERQEADINGCINTKIISDRPSFCIKNNSTEVIKELEISLLREEKVIQRVILKEGIENRSGYFIFNIPFQQFLKTDTIVVKQKEEIYKISDFTYNSDGGHWGMFGYLGDADCYFDYSSIKINGLEYKGLE